MELLSPPKTPASRSPSSIARDTISPSGRSAKTPSRQYASPVGQRKLISRGKSSMQSHSAKESDNELDFFSELSGRKKNKQQEVDIESCDLDTLLASRPQTANYDHNAMVCSRYEQKCRQLKVIPVSLFLRQCGSSTLNLQNHQLGPKGIHALATALLIDTSLTMIDLSGNDIKDEGVKYLAEALSENHFVTDLRIARNGLTAKGAHYICLLLEHNGCITSLDISGNHLGDKAMPFIEEMIQEIRILQKLNLADNDLGEESGVVLGNIIATNETLISLSLSWNQIRLKGATAIAKGVKENVRLHFLDLSYNGLGQEAAELLGKSLMENQVIRILDLTSTRLNDQAILLLAKGLERNEGLEKLVLSSNPFTNSGAYGLLKSLQKNEHQHMKLIEMKGIPVKEDFLEVLDEIKEINPQLQVKFDVVPVKKSLANPVEMLFTYLQERNKTPSDIFGSAEEDATRLYTRSEFNSMLQSAGVSMNAELRQRLAVMLDKQDNGLVHVGFLFRKWKDKHAEVTKEPDHSSDSQSEVPPAVAELQAELEPDLRASNEEAKTAPEVITKQTADTQLEESSEELETTAAGTDEETNANTRVDSPWDDKEITGVDNNEATEEEGSVLEARENKTSVEGVIEKGETTELEDENIERETRNPSAMESIPEE